MKALVTGSSGFIGSQLCRALLARGFQVRAFHRATSPLRLLEGLEVEHAVGDLTRPDTLAVAMQDVEVVFHAAAWMGGNDPGRFYAVTVEGTRAVLAAARQHGVRRVVHTSSAAALGVPEVKGDCPMNENHTWNLRPDVYPYGYAKYLAEMEVQKAVAQGLDVVIVNPTMVFGAGDLYRQSRSILMQVAAGKVGVTIEGGINVVHITDVVNGHLAALEKGHTGERYLLGGENLSYLSMLQKMATVTGGPAPSLVLPAWLARALGRVAGVFRNVLDLPVEPDLLRLAGYSFYYDTRKAEVELGVRALHPAEEAFAEAYAWFTSQGK